MTDERRDGPAVAIIPARGGSKRIPRKNIRMFHGRPMIAWPITTALESGCFDRVIVSTDDEEIAAVARQWGAEVPFMRPAELADDHTGTRAVIQHAIAALGGDSAPEIVACIYPCTPLLQPKDLRSAMARVRAGETMIVSVAEFPSPIQRALRLTGEGHLQRMHPEHAMTRMQDLEPAYHDAGQFHLGRCMRWCDADHSTVHGSGAHVLPGSRAVDIDTEDDWHLAECLFLAVGQP